MKKALLIISMFLMFTSTNLFGAITVTLSSTMSSSTTYPGYYDVKLSLTALDNSGCAAGLYTFSVERRQLYPTLETTFSQITLSPSFPIDNTHDGVYTGSGYTYQLPGRRYEYQVKVFYGNGCPAANKTTNQVICQGAKPDFSLGNAGTVLPNLGGPLTLCLSDLKFNLGLCDLETKYYIGISECNLWWEKSGNFDWGWWYLQTAPNSIRNIQDEINAHPTGFEAAPVPAPILLDGTIISPSPLAGQVRYYRITVATGEPTWMTKAALIKVDQGCRVSVVEVKDSNEMPQELVSLYPNPVKDNLTVSLKANQLIKKISFFDINNNLVKEEKYNGKNNEMQLNLSALKKGLYFIAIETTEGLIRNKIVKE